MNDSAEQRQRAFDAALVAMWERWQFLKKEPEVRMHSATFKVYSEPNMQKLYPGDITGERVVPCMRSAGVMVDMAYFIGADQEYLGHAMLPLQDVKRTVEPLRDTLQNWLASLTRADERNPGNARNELAIIGIRAFAREMDITLPNMAVGVEREV